MKFIRLEPIGTIPRPLALIKAVSSVNSEDAPTTRDTAFEKIRAQSPSAVLAGESIHRS